MKRSKWLSGAVAVLAALVSAAPPASADEQGWGMLVHSPMVGYVYLYMTDAGFAIVLPKTGAKFVTHAPDWQVVLYNDKTKLYFVERMSDLQSLAKTAAGGHTKTLPKASLQSPRKGKDDRTAWGMKEVQYFLKAYSPEGGQKNSEVWITPDIRPPAQFPIVLGKIFAFDTSNFPAGMPLKVTVSNEVGKSQMIWQTLKCQRQVIHSASFNYPATYKKADNELAVLVDDESRKKMEAILEDSQDIDAMLGTSSPSTPAARSAANRTGSYPAGRGYSQTRPRQASPPQSAAGGQSKQGGDWWSNMFNSLGSGK